MHMGSSLNLRPFLGPQYTMAAYSSDAKRDPHLENRFRIQDLTRGVRRPIGVWELIVTVDDNYKSCITHDREYTILPIV